MNILFSKQFLKWELFKFPEYIQVLLTLMLMADDWGIVSPFNRDTVASIMSRTGLPDVILKRCIVRMQEMGILSKGSNKLTITLPEGVEKPTQALPKGGVLDTTSGVIEPSVVYVSEPRLVNAFAKEEVMLYGLSGEGKKEDDLVSISPGFFTKVDEVVSVKDAEATLNSEVGPITIIDEIKSDMSKGVQRFQKPTIEQVAAYVKQKNYHFDPETFWNFYESKGWMIGKNHMKSWHAACVTFEKRQRDDQRKQQLNSQTAYERTRNQARAQYLSAESQGALGSQEGRNLLDLIPE